MKERSKNAARCRREKENAEFANLAKLLPLPTSMTSQLDKASIIRLSSSYLKLRKLFPNGLGSEWGADSTSLTRVEVRDLGYYLEQSINETLKYSPRERLSDLGSYLLQSLDGFLLVLAADAKLIYVSETASVNLGFSQIEMTGNSIFDYIDKGNIPEIEALLNYEEIVQSPGFPGEEINYPVSFCLMMRCVLAKRNAGLVSGNYKVIHCRGYQRLRTIKCTPSDDTSPPRLLRKVVGLTVVCHSLPSSAVTDIKMSKYTFMFRAALDFKLTYVEQSVENGTGYEPHHLTERSLYKLVHPDDCIRLRNDHCMLIRKTQAITMYYRLLTCGGGWIWIQSQCMLLQSNRARHACILAINHCLSEIENAGILFDVEQQKESTSNCNIQHTFAAPAKRPRLQFPIANRAPSKSKKGVSSSTVPSLKAANCYQNDSAAMQSTNFKSPYPFNPNVSTQNNAFITSDERNVKLQKDLSDFEQAVEECKRKHFSMGEHATQTSLDSDTGEEYYKYYKSQNLYNSDNPPSVVNPVIQSSAYNMPGNFTNNYTPCYPANSKSDLPYKESAIVSPIEHAQIVKSINSLEIKSTQDCASSSGDSGHAELPPYVEYINKEPLSQTHENFSKDISIGANELIFSSEASQRQLEPQSSFENSTNFHSYETGSFNQCMLNQFGTENFNHKFDDRPQSLFPSTSEIQNYGLTDSKNFDCRPNDIYSSSATCIPSSWTNTSFTNDIKPAPISENRIATSDFSRQFYTSARVSPSCFENVSTANAFVNSMETLRSSTSSSPANDIKPASISENRITNTDFPRHFYTSARVSPSCFENVTTANAFMNSIETLRSSTSSSPGLSEISILSDTSSDHNRLSRYISPEFHNELYGHYNYNAVSNPNGNVPSPIEYKTCEEIKKTEPSEIQSHSYAPDNLVYSNVSQFLPPWKPKSS